MFCHTCRCHVTPTPPKSIWKVLSTGYWIGSLVIALCFSILLGLNLVLAPVAIVIGMSIGAAARKLYNWTCPNCDAELIEPEPEDEMVPLRRWRRLKRRLEPAATPT
ncbi:MAG: hypothetical protein BGO98_03060 [Myxococcales bacterium 68-20]|nr:hypothetical protein [Myxococcales bacterium]OJY21812.1 MAG: hypothetical protein BGO98_03060 [Myxococcales bacterium 68-20]